MESEGGFGTVIESDQFQGVGFEVGKGEGQGEAEESGSGEESAEVLCPAEGFAVVDAQGFEQAVAVEEAPVEDGDAGFGFRDERIIEEG
jgi:hypothetical protein